MCMQLHLTFECCGLKLAIIMTKQWHCMHAVHTFMVHDLLGQCHGDEYRYMKGHIISLKVQTQQIS